MTLHRFTGQPIWDSITLGDSIWSSPAIALINDQPMVFFGSYAGPLHGIVIGKSAALAKPGSNLNFWITLPIVILLVTMLTLYLSRRKYPEQ